MIYAAYRAIVDKGDKVIYAVPSWNNNHYVHFTEGEHVVIESKLENNFMPTADEIKPHLEGTSLLALCSPLNPTGTTFTKEAIEESEILISLRLWNLEENNTINLERKKNNILLTSIEKEFNLPYKIQEKVEPGRGIKIADRIYINQDHQFQWRIGLAPAGL